MAKGEDAPMPEAVSNTGRERGYRISFLLHSWGLRNLDTALPPNVGGRYGKSVVNCSLKIFRENIMVYNKYMGESQIEC